MKIYTKTGDGGETGLFAGPRVAKDHARIEAYGTVDELNAMLGLARSQQLPVDLDQVLERIQNELFAVGAELAAYDTRRLTVAPVGQHHLSSLERDIDRWESQLDPLQNFILPGGIAGAAALHVARTVCRRAERCVVTMNRESEPTDSDLAVAYLNRLGDLLFVAARLVNRIAGQGDCIWQGDSLPGPLNPAASVED